MKEATPNSLLSKMKEEATLNNLLSKTKKITLDSLLIQMKASTILY